MNHLTNEFDWHNNAQVARMELEEDEIPKCDWCNDEAPVRMVYKNYHLCIECFETNTPK